MDENETGIPSDDPEVEKCPNGCGELDYARGLVYSKGCRTCWEVTIPYCPVCMWYGDAEAEF